MHILRPFMDEEEIVKSWNIRWDYSRWEFSGWEFSGAEFSRGEFDGWKFSWGNFPRTLKKTHFK